MIERSTVIPWEVEEEVKLKCLQDARGVVLTELRALFPEAEGFQFKVDKEGKHIQVMRDLTWGLYVTVKDTEKGLKLRVGRNSKLTTLVSILGFCIGITLAGMWLWKNDDPLRTGLGQFFFTWALMGLIYGVALVQLVHWIMQPWLSMPSSAVLKLMDALREDVAQKVSPGSRVPLPQQNEPS